MNAALPTNDQQSLGPDRAGQHFSSKRLRAILMDDSQFDRKTFGRIASNSKYDIDLLETSSILETREVLAEQNPDVIFLDFRVPDGDGIEFSRELTSSGPDAPPVIIVTGEGDEMAAIRSIRSGAVDYLPKGELSVAGFDGAIEAALSARVPVSERSDEEIEAVYAELSMLRRKANENMNLAKAYLMPMAQHAWKSINSLPAHEQRFDAERLFKITQRLTGFLDETLIHSATECRIIEPELIKLYDALEFAVSSSSNFSENVKLGTPDQFPALHGRWSHFVMLFKELCQDAMANVPKGTDPDIRIDCVSDPAGNPIIRVTDNGVGLRARQQSLVEASDGVASGNWLPTSHGLSITLCQRLAELNGGQLKIKDAETGGCVTMIRFPSRSVGRH